MLRNPGRLHANNAVGIGKGDRRSGLRRRQHWIKPARLLTAASTARQTKRQRDNKSMSTSWQHWRHLLHPRFPYKAVQRPPARKPRHKPRTFGSETSWRHLLQSQVVLPLRLLLHFLDGISRRQRPPGRRVAASTRHKSNIRHSSERDRGERNGGRRSRSFLAASGWQSEQPQTRDNTCACALRLVALSSVVKIPVPWSAPKQTRDTTRKGIATSAGAWPEGIYRLI